MGDVICYALIPSPIGALLSTSRGAALSGLYVHDRDRGPQPGPDWHESPERFTDLVAQLEEYFAGRRRWFDLELDPAGTPFQQDVWAALRRIPYGETRTYGDIAAEVGRPRAARAVGAANGRNPISIVIPCHRLVGSTGALTGYAGGLDRKRALLALEGGADG